jgi:hypothetical protein
MSCRAPLSGPVRIRAVNVPPVREVIPPGENGLVEPLFNVERLASLPAVGAR